MHSSSFASQIFSPVNAAGAQLPFSPLRVFAAAAGFPLLVSSRFLLFLSLSLSRFPPKKQFQSFFSGCTLQLPSFPFPPSLFSLSLSLPFPSSLCFFFRIISSHPHTRPLDFI